MELELNLSRKNNPISKWKIFIFTAVVVFALTTVQNLGFKGFLSPFPFHNSTFDKVKPKLEEKSNIFKVKKSASIIESSFASSGDLLNAASYVAVDFDSGNVILEKNLSQKLPIASLTKIMTAVVALDLLKPEEEITISKRATTIEPTTIGVVKNQKMTTEELLYATLLTSANDAAEALKNGIDVKYEGDVFIKAMNAKAQFIGLKNTSFANPQGFDDVSNYSTVEDLAILTHYALSNYPLISEIVEKDYKFLPKSVKHKQFDLYNWNGLLGTYPGIKGVKIGNTDNAGFTTTVLSEREGRKILAILLGAPGVLERDLWTSQILDEGFQKLAGFKPVALTEFDLQQKYSTWKYWN